MATLYTHADSNIRKTWLLMSLFLVIIIAIGWFLSFYFNRPSLLYISFIFSIIMNVVSYWHSDKIALGLAGAKEVGREEYPEVFRITENLCITAGLPLPKICIINDPAPNAFATGRDKNHAAIALTTGLIGMMDKNELSGVIAHELAHIGNRDTLLQTVIVVLVGIITILSNILIRGSFDRRDNRSGGGQLGFILVVIGLVLVILSPIVAEMIKLAISRKREFLADASGALLTRYPEGLASALSKIGSYGSPMRRADNSTAHLYISNPFGAKALKGLNKLFMTHPPIEERIAALRNSAE